MNKGRIAQERSRVEEEREETEQRRLRELALLQNMERLNGIMQDVAKNILKVLEINIMTTEIRKGIVLLDKGMAYFGVSLEEAIPTRPVVASDFTADGGSSSGTAVTHNDGGHKEKAIDQPVPNYEVATPTLQREVKREVHVPVLEEVSPTRK
ncbi:hypothetical protein PIB30_007932 [Stylosanthes scabra]|uniref:Uncharacterized protein n=1 Tax=Stylosanthes scabra TaxID=79078 RepID=A0ABU6S600_9FABA|nr:hypothetical protein [Stylosanthes scabra]